MFSIQGRVPRSKFWLVFLLTIGISFVLILFSILAIPALVLMASFSPNIASAVSILLNLLLIPLWIFSIVTNIKRFHDRDKSGWWLLIALIPVVGALWILVECGFLKGTAGANRFGDNPLPSA